MYGTSNFQPFTWRYILDSLLSHFVILGLVICSWSGLFNVIGYMVFPDNTLLSDIVCLLVGLFLAILLLLLEELFARVTVALEKEAFTYKLLFEDFCYLLIFVANVVLWRGAWRLVARYVNRCSSCWSVVPNQFCEPATVESTHHNGIIVIRCN